MTIPASVLADLGIEAGGAILLRRTDSGRYEMLPDALVPEDQRWFYHPEMQARVARAEKEFRDGSVTRTFSVAEAQALLDSLKGQPETP